MQSTQVKRHRKLESFGAETSFCHSQFELFIEPVLNDRLSLIESLPIHAHNYSGMTVPHIMDVHAILAETHVV